jgi:adenosylhomocysteine nucleosidase
MKLAILSALPEEQFGIIELLQNARTTQSGGRTYHHGTIGSTHVVVALSRIGKVAAATTAASLILEHRCSAILFTGVAGGLGAHVRVGDVVIANALMQHDLDASPIFPKYEVPLYGKSMFKTDATLSERVRAACATFAPNVHTGLIVSGDRFVSTREECTALKRALPDALAVEMEGAAVAQVCFDYGVPCAIVRTISDRADDDAHVDFTRFVREVASRYSVRAVKALLGVAA